MFLDSIVVIYLNQTYNLISGRVNSIICSSGRRFNTLQRKLNNSWIQHLDLKCTIKYHKNYKIIKSLSCFLKIIGNLNIHLFKHLLFMLICQTKYYASLYFINNHAPNALSTCSNIKTNILSEIFYFNFTCILYLHFIIYCVQKSFKVLKCITRKLVILHRNK